MIVRKLKLKLNVLQERELEQWLLSLASVYNFAIRKIELDAKDKIYHTPYNFQNLLNGHSKKLVIPSHTIQGTLMQAYNAWQRCFKKLAKKPRLKGRRNKLNSIIFPDPIKQNYQNMVNNGYRINLPGIGKIKFHKQDIPAGKIKLSRIIKRPSGWYLALWIDTVYTFPVKDTDKAVGIDPGFKTLLTLSDGTKYENPRELKKGELRLAQAQRGRKSKLSARLLERQANRRNDRNHKISRKLVENYKVIKYSNDNFKGLAHMHGKSVSEASLGRLIGMITYKSRLGGRDVISVNSRYTTMTCSACGAKTGPHGWGGLAVRNWECSACGAVHDRDINSAVVVLNSGAGVAHKEAVNVLN
ncbi:MAG: RNA-guided endonuclease InsQ/TnpB family protein [bacterium]